MRTVASVVNRMHNAHIQTDKFSINYTRDSGSGVLIFLRVPAAVAAPAKKPI